MTDWMDAKRQDRFAFEQVDPNDLDAPRGWLDGVVLRDCGITQGYYTDMRESATVVAVDPGYIENSLIRIHHYVDAWDYHAELGTFFVESIEPTVSDGHEAVSFSLVSMMARVSDDRLVAHYPIPQGRYALTALRDLAGRYGVDLSIAGNCPDSRYSKTALYEFGESVMTVFFEVADKSGARLGVSGHGAMTAERYVAPSARTPVFEFSDTNGTIVGKVKITSDFFSSTNRTGVIAKQGEAEVMGYADLQSSSLMSRSRRGRRVTVTYNDDELSPFTRAAAARVARSYLDEDAGEDREYEFDGVYVPMRDGDAATVVLAGVAHKCMLKTRDVPLSPGMVCSYVFKEV